MSRDLFTVGAQEGTQGVPSPTHRSYPARARRGHRPRILIIDDDIDQRLLFGTLIEKQGKFDVVEAGNAVEALEILWAEEIDCVVCDVMLPGMSGTEFLQTVRLTSRISDLPVLMLTAGRREMELPLITLGADMFCLKEQATSMLVFQIELLLR